MKKLLAIILSLCLVAGALFCFASCDNDDKKPDDNDTEQGGNTPDDGGNTPDDSGNTPDDGDEDGSGDTEPDLTDDDYPEDAANDIF